MALTARVTNMNGLTVAEKRNGQHRVLTQDPAGNITEVRDQSGTLLASYSYWPFGESQFSTGSIVNPWRFGGANGYYFDGTSYYVRARTYLPDLTRWATVDRTWPMERPYAYSWSNPVTWADPSGLSPLQGLPPKTCCPDLSSAKAMIEAAYATGGVAAARSVAMRIACACPYLAAAVAGWFAGRYIDDHFGISDWALGCLFPDETGPTSKEELQRCARSRQLDIIVRRKTDRKRKFFCVVTCEHRSLFNNPPCFPRFLCGGAAGTSCAEACNAAERAAGGLASPGCNKGHCKRYCPNPPSPAKLNECKEQTRSCPPSRGSTGPIRYP